MTAPRTVAAVEEIGLIGAAGQTGRHVLAALARRGASPRAIVHRESQAELAREWGATATAVADLEDPGSLVAALDGVGAVHVVPPLFNPDEAELIANAVGAARAAGVDRFSYHSVLHPDTPELRHHRRKSAAEAVIRHSDLTWTILRPGMYAQTVLVYVRPDTDVVEVPYSLDAPFSVIDVVDVAEAAATVLLEGGHAFATYELTGPDLLTMGELIEQAGAALGRPLTGTVVAPWRLSREGVTARLEWTLSGWADLCAMWSHYDRSGLVGNPAAARLVLGREPTTFRASVERAA